MSALSLTTNNNDKKKVLIRHILLFAIRSPFLSAAAAVFTRLYKRTDISDWEAASRWGLRLRKFHFLLHPKGGANLSSWSPLTPSPSTNKQLKTCREPTKEPRSPQLHHCQGGLEPTASSLTTAAKQKKAQGVTSTRN